MTILVSRFGKIAGAGAGAGAAGEGGKERT